MHDPRFTVIVPTRERADTLVHALRTCLEQDFDSYEILVSDNCSSPPTKEVVDTLGSARIRYLRTSRPLAMRDNWEFAVSKAAGEYVLIIGDDDGLLLNALRDIDRVLRELGVMLLRWERVGYFWPSVSIEGAANRISIPLGRELEWLDSRRVALDVANNRIDFAPLPSLYHGAIHRDFISTLRSRTGRVFQGTYPDVYSGFALAYLADKYCSLTCPMSIAGTSPHSVGVATIYPGGRRDVAEDFSTLNASAELHAHPMCPELSCLPAVLADAFLHFKDALCPDDRLMQLDRRHLAAECVRCMSWTSEEDWRKGLEAIRRSLADVPRLQRWFDREFKSHQPQRHLRGQVVPTWGVNGSRLVIDASKFGVADVYGAAELAERVLGQRDHDPGLPKERQRLSPYRRIRGAARILVKGR